MFQFGQLVPELSCLQNVALPLRLSGLAWARPAHGDTLGPAPRRMADVVQPGDVVLIRTGSLPKTTSGKIQRRLTRQMFLAGTLSLV